MLSSSHSQQKKDNRKCPLKIISNLKFLTGQGLPLRGDYDTDSNFMQLMKLRARDDPRLAEWLEKKTNKYVSHDIQNELLKVVALSVLQGISHSIQESTFYSIMNKENASYPTSTYVSSKEMVRDC
ncbi:Zinc finger MYM-type protein 1-like [Oopsacas minuta]|uniref:Zinc finger MYM-type protein 1-like n=1 Tax=Oopsacas minuta TaxID=111878 RepID=A0AAV7JIJ4_9METZ|nr:Zinc finger MYM-type protein 1-like [Oopsacas minuta]